MSIFSSILSKIFPKGHPAAATASASSSPQSGDGGTAGAPAAAPGSAGPAGAAPQDAAAAPASAASAPVDVQAVLEGMAKNHSEQLNWRTSIVDLMKLLGLDSGLASRKQLAQELGYSGDMSDSAQMNVWLHKQVMTQVAQNGGKVPEDLKH